MENKNFNACRIVLTSGNIIIHYITGASSLGLACAGTLANGNCTVPYADGKEKFQETAKEWARRFADCDGVEYIEYI